MSSLRVLLAFATLVVVCATLTAVGEARRDPSGVISALGRELLVVPRGGVELKKYKAAQAARGGEEDGGIDEEGDLADGGIEDLEEPEDGVEPDEDEEPDEMGADEIGGNEDDA